ncbi:unnamed protein product [Effrenium voratum]|nr:unnamed protein product [Effrenium voratum]
MTADSKVESKVPQSCAEFALYTTLKILGVLTALYFFLFGLDLMGGSFGALGGKRAGQLFTITDNPIAGLMVGILATVLVQSSSTSTSIVVGLVGAEVLTVRRAIPIIMGANIGTSVTNTIVSMAHVGDRLELERAFSGATVHDMFNMLSVLTLLPIEIIIAAISGEGGLLYWISKGLTDAILGNDASDLTFPSPTKAIVSPLTKAVLSKDKNVVKALSFGAPLEHAIPASFCGSADCGTYYCVSEGMSKAWKKVAEEGYEALQVCGAFANDCGSDACYLDAGNYYTTEIEGARLIGKGFLKDVGDVAGGILGLTIALIVMCVALYVMVRLLHSLVMGQAKRVIMKGTQMNDYLAMLLGVALTLIVQSSSVTTSALTPLVGIGVLPVAKMLPMGSTRLSQDPRREYRDDIYFHVRSAGCYEGGQHPDRALPSALQHHRHPHLVPCAPNEEGDHPRRLHLGVLCLLLALRAADLHLGDVFGRARSDVGHLPALPGQRRRGHRGDNLGSGRGCGLGGLVVARGLLQGGEPRGARAPTGAGRGAG